MKLDQRLVDAAIAEIDHRFLDEVGIAAALYTSEGDIFLGVRFKLARYEQGRLCAETEAILAAYRYNKTVTASVCMYHNPDDGRYLVLSPCGLCQERLHHWGKNVEVAVPHPDDPTRWLAKTLDELAPHYWRDVID